MKKRTSSYLIATFATAMSLILGVRYSHQVQNHRLLSSHDATEISRIQVGEATLADKGQIDQVAQALRDKRWFSSAGGGWADTVPLVISLQDGGTLQFRVGYYLRREGAVIEFFRGSERSYWADGYAFCPRLPSALAQVGARLPFQPVG